MIEKERQVFNQEKQLIINNQKQKQQYIEDLEKRLKQSET